MPYKELSLSTQLNGAYRCAATVVLRMAAADVTHHCPGIDRNDEIDNVHSKEIKEPHCMLWLARNDGNIEVRSASVPNPLIAVIPNKSQGSVVTSLLQISSSRVVAGQTDGMLRVFDVASMQECQRVLAHKGTVTCIVKVALPRITPTSSVTAPQTQTETDASRTSVFVTGSLDGTIAKWDAVTLDCICRIKSDHASYGITALAAAGGGRFIVGGGEDGSLRMWSLLDGAQVMGRSSGKKGTTPTTKKAKAAKAKAVMSSSATSPVNQQQSEEEEANKRRRKQLLLPVRREDSIQTPRRSMRAPEAFVQRKRRSTSTQTTSRVAASKPTTPRLGHSCFSPAAAGVKSADMPVTCSRRSASVQGAARTPRARKTASVTLSARSMGVNNRNLRAGSPLATEKTHRKEKKGTKTTVSKSKPTTPRLSLFHHLVGGNRTKDVVSEGNNSNAEEEEEDNEEEEEEEDEHELERNVCLFPGQALNKSRHQPHSFPTEESINNNTTAAGTRIANDINAGPVNNTKASKKSAKTKKSKKNEISHFSSVARQFVGASSEDDPIIQRFLARQHVHAKEEVKDSVLLWPLKFEHYQAVTGLDVVRDRILLSSSRDGVAKMFLLPSGRMIYTIHRGRTALTSIALDEGTYRLFIGSADGMFTIYDLLQENVVVQNWRDYNTLHPQLLLLPTPNCISHLYVLTAAPQRGRGKKNINNNNNNNNHSSHSNQTDTSSLSKVNKKSLLSKYRTPTNATTTTTTSGNKLHWSNGDSPSISLSTLTCILPEWGDYRVIMDMSLLRSLNEQFIRDRQYFLGNHVYDSIFKKILGRNVGTDGEELPNYIHQEKLHFLSIIQLSSRRLLEQKTFSRWLVWAKKRRTRYRCLRHVCFLENTQHERLMGNYFHIWKRWKNIIINSSSNSKYGKRNNGESVFLLEYINRNMIEKYVQKISSAPVDWLSVTSKKAMEENEKKRRRIEIILYILSRNEHLLQRYYYQWFMYARDIKRRVTQSTCFNKLFLSLSDEKFKDSSFFCIQLKKSAEAKKRHQSALWLLEKKLFLLHQKQRRDYMKKWIKYCKNQKEGRHSSVLVDTLSSVLVNEHTLRRRVYDNWYHYARYEAKLLRAREEKKTLQWEWIAVQNAIDNTSSLVQLKHEEEELETDIAHHAFERDEVQHRNATLLADIKYLQAQKSLDSLLIGYQDPLECMRKKPESLSLSRGRLSNNTNREKIFASLDDHHHHYHNNNHQHDNRSAFDNDTFLLRQVGLVLRALNATTLRYGRHKSFLFASYDRVIQLHIPEYPSDAFEHSCSVSSSSLGKESASLRMPMNTSYVEARTTASEGKRSISGLISMPGFLPDEFDRTVHKLKGIIENAANLTGVHMNETFHNDSLSSTMKQADGHMDKNINTTTTDHSSLRWIHFIPPSTRAEVLPLVIDLITMFDSFKAHSDMEVEAGEKKLSTRGAARVMPLPLRSLCKPQTAIWLCQNAAVLLELMSPGIWQRHLKLRALADEMAESSTGNGNSDAAESSPTRSTEATVNSENLPGAFLTSLSPLGTSEEIPQRVPPQILHKLSERELDIHKKRHRSLSWAASDTRRQGAHKLSMPPSRASKSMQQMKFLVLRGSSLTPRPQMHYDFDDDDAAIGPRLSLPIPAQATHSSTSTPTKSSCGSALTRPYLGFRVAVGRNDTGRTTLTVHEIAESYISANDNTTREGPAFAAGLRAGDQLVRFAGYAVTELASFNTLVSRHVRPWVTVPVVFSRDGNLLTANILVGEKSRGG